jgi:hypothetical protein
VDAQLAVSERLPIEEFMSYYQVQGPYSCYGQYNVHIWLPAGQILDLPALMPQEVSKLYLTSSRVAQGMLDDTLYHGHPLYDLFVETVTDAAPARLQEAKVVAIGAGPSGPTWRAGPPRSKPAMDISESMVYLQALTQLYHRLTSRIEVVLGVMWLGDRKSNPAFSKEQMKALRLKHTRNLQDRAS